MTLEIAALGLATGFGFLAMQEVIRLLLELRPAPTAASAGWLATMTAGGSLPPALGVPDGPAQVIERTHASAWTALYLVAAAGRLAEATEHPGALSAASAAEERYYELHLAAEARRMRAAAAQDMAALLNVDRERPDLLGWRAVMDRSTTPECRWAHGRNFRADQMPEIGWPGAVHVRCRCAAGPPVPGAPLIPSL